MAAGSSSAAAEVVTTAASNAVRGSCRFPTKVMYDALLSELNNQYAHKHPMQAGHTCIRSSDKSGTRCCLRSSRPLPPGADRWAASCASRLGPWRLLAACTQVLKLSKGVVGKDEGSAASTMEDVGGWMAAGKESLPEQRRPVSLPHRLRLLGGWRACRP